MILIRHAKDRGYTKTNWLDSFHTFSFAEYYDANYMSFGHLRVINEDIIQSGKGFGMHSHANMEIITYVIEGELEHKDSMGTGSVIKPGEIQKMSAGSGVKHSEFNHSPNHLLHLLQIWIIPNKSGITPAYEQKNIPKSNNQFLLIGSPTGGDHAVAIQQDVNLYTAYLTKNSSLDYVLKENRSAWLQVVKGEIELNGNLLSAGAGAAITDEQQLKINSHAVSEILLFDLG